VSRFNGVDLQAYHPLTARAAIQLPRPVVIERRQFVILYQGRLDADKQPLLLADIAARLDCSAPAPSGDAGGRSGEMQSQLAQAVKSQGLTHRVRSWAGRPSRPARCSLADAVLLLRCARACAVAHQAQPPDCRACQRYPREPRSGHRRTASCHRERESLSEALFG